MRNTSEGGRLSVLSDEELREIHFSSLRILEDCGVQVEGSSAQEILREAGADVDHETHCVRISKHLVEESIKKAPKSVRLAGRDPGNDFILEGSKVFFRACGLAPNIIDLETGLRRRSTISDVKNGARLSDALSEIDCANEVSAAFDVPAEVVGLYKQDVMMSNTTKHILLAREHGLDIERERIRLAALVAGGNDKLKERPIVSMFIEPISPLSFSREDCDVMIEWARAGLPLVCVSAPASGSTSPVTLAGTIAQGVAESLMGNVIIQQANPGAPFIFGMLAFSTDMRTGLLRVGSIENMLMCAAMGQIARYHKLPCIGFAGGSDSSSLDSQAILEASMSMTMCALSGINVIQGIGYLDSGLTGSYESLVISNEIAHMLRRVLKGVSVNEETLGVDVIQKARHHKSRFLAQAHTVKHFRTEHVALDLIGKLPLAELRKLGHEKLEVRAKEKIKKILANHHVPPIDEDLRKEMTLIISAAEEKHRAKI